MLNLFHNENKIFLFRRCFLQGYCIGIAKTSLIKAYYETRGKIEKYEVVLDGLEIIEG